MFLYLIIRQEIQRERCRAIGRGYLTRLCTIHEKRGNFLYVIDGEAEAVYAECIYSELLTMHSLT
jgi:hypothetical protein